MATLLGVRSKNHRNDQMKNGVDVKADDRRTPAYIFDPLHVEHQFTLDAAASADNAKCARFFDIKRNGLIQHWAGEVVWCNPPYSDLAAWVQKALHEVEHGCLKVVMLLPANRTEQRWWQDWIEPIRERKRTWLYIVGLRGGLPEMPAPREPTHWASGGRTRSSRQGSPVPPGIKVCSAQQRRRTPTDFARWLVELASKCNGGLP